MAASSAMASSDSSAGLLCFCSELSSSEESEESEEGGGMDWAEFGCGSTTCALTGLCGIYQWQCLAGLCKW